MKKQYKQYFKNSFSLLLFLVLTSTLLTSCSNKLDEGVPFLNNKVTFDVDGGSAVAAQTVAINSKATKPAPPIKDGYHFDDWYQDSDKTEVFDFNTPITGNTTIYAKWTAAVAGEYIIKFEENGGSSIPDQTLTKNEKVTKPAPPTRTGYHFEDWYQDIALTDLFDFDIPITADTTIYAKWTAAVLGEYEVTFEVNGGSTINKQTVKENEKATRPPSDPTRTGYAFVDWYEDITLTKIFDFDTPITTDTNIYAKWRQTIFTVTFDTDGGTTVNSQIVNENAKATEPVPIKYGFRVEGWYQDSAQTMPFDFNDFITADMKLYVKWKVAQDIDMFTISGDVITLNPSAGATYIVDNGNIENTHGVVDPADMQKSTDIDNTQTGGGHYKSKDTTKDGILLKYEFADVVDIESYKIIPRTGFNERSDDLTIVMYDASGAEIGTQQLGIGEKTVRVPNVKTIALAISTNSTETHTQFNYITVKLKK